MEFSWDLISAIVNLEEEIFIDPRNLNPVKTSMKLVVNNVMKTTIWLVTFMYSTWDPREINAPLVKSEIQIRENVFPRFSKNPKSAKFYPRRKFYATW